MRSVAHQLRLLPTERRNPIWIIAVQFPGQFQELPLLFSSTYRQNGYFTHWGKRFAACLKILTLGVVEKTLRGKRPYDLATLAVAEILYASTDRYGDLSYVAQPYRLPQ